MSSNNRLDTDIALQVTKSIATYLTNFVPSPAESILGWMTAEDAPFGFKTSLDGIRHPQEEVTVSSEIEYNTKYARRYRRRLDMPSVTDEIRIQEEDYAGDIVNAMGHVSDLGENFVEALNLFSFEGTLKPLMYGLSDFPDGTSGTRERPEMVEPPTTNGAWDVPTNITKDVAELKQALIAKKFYGQKIILAHPIFEPMLDLVMTNTATPAGMVPGIKGTPIIYNHHVDSDATIAAGDIYMVDASKFAYTMTPLRIKSFFDDNTEDWVWRWQTRFVLRPKPLYDETQWLKGVTYMTVDMYTA